MQNVTKISVALTREMARDVRAAVRSGEYATASEAVRDALRLWQARENFRAPALDAAEVARLRKAWDEGVASGPLMDGPKTMARLVARARDKAKPARKKHASS